MQQSNQVVNFNRHQRVQNQHQQHLTNVLQNQLSGPAPLNELNGSPLIPARQQQHLPVNSYSQDVVLAAKPTSQLKPTFFDQNDQNNIVQNTTTTLNTNQTHTNQNVQISGQNNATTTLADRVVEHQKPQVVQQSASTPSQTSGSTAQIPAQQQADVALLGLVVKSEVLELIQDLNSQFDALSPDQVRHRLRTLTQAETEARFRREQYLSAVVRQRAIQESQRLREQFEEHMKRTFEIETVRFEKLLKERAQSVIKNIKIHQLDRLINIGSNLRQIQKTHAEQKQIQNDKNNRQSRPESGQQQRSPGPPDDRSAPESTSNQPEDHHRQGASGDLEQDIDEESRQQLESQLANLVNHVESLMKEISADDHKDASAFDQHKMGANDNENPSNTSNQNPSSQPNNNIQGGEFASVDNLNQNRLTSPFTQAQLPKSTTNNEVLLGGGATQSNPSGPISQNDGGPEIPAAGGNPFGAAVSYGVTSGEVGGLVPVTSGSNQILSSNTISGEGGQLFLANQTLNQKQIANLQRSDNSILNQQPAIQKPNEEGNMNNNANQLNQAGNKPRFVYDLPTDFPFNQVCIQKSLSNDIGGSSGGPNLPNNRSSANGGSGSIIGGGNLQNANFGGPLPGGKSQERIGNRDVTPEEVLRSFTNQTSCLLDAIAQDSQGKLLDRGNSQLVASGETLQSIHQSLTYYKEALQSKDWSNLSPSNAYQNYMFRKNLVGEIQKLAKEISRIPTEEAKILADLSKSHLSNHESFKRFQNGGGISSSNFIVGQSIKSSIPGNILHPSSMNNQEGQMATASQIAQGLGFIGNNESSVLMDLNRASIVAAQREAEEAAIKSQTRRIVDDSVTRLERLEHPVVQDFTNAPIDGNLMEPQYKLIKYQQQRSSLMEGSNSNMFDSTKIMHDLTHKPSQDRSSSVMRDSQVVYGAERTSDKKHTIHMMAAANNYPIGGGGGSTSSVNKHNSHQQSDSEIKQKNKEKNQDDFDELGGIQVGSATPDNNEMIMYTTSTNAQEQQQQDCNDENSQKKKRQSDLNDFTMGPPIVPSAGIMQGQDPRGYASVVITQTGQVNDRNKCETPDLTLNLPAADHYQRDKKGIEAAAAEAARGSMPMSGDLGNSNQYQHNNMGLAGGQQLSPKQRGSIAMKKNKNKPLGAGFFSNDNVPVLSEIELDRLQMEQTAPQQIASFAPKDSSGWLFEDAEEFAKNQNFFNQTNQSRIPHDTTQSRGGARSQLQSNRGHANNSVIPVATPHQSSGNPRHRPNAHSIGANGYQQGTISQALQNYQHRKGSRVGVAASGTVSLAGPASSSYPHPHPPYENHNNNIIAHEDLGAKSSQFLDNKGRAIPMPTSATTQIKNDQSSNLGSGNLGLQQNNESGTLLEDELNRTATYKISKSALDGHHGFSYRKTSHLNKTMMVSGKVMGTLPSFRADKAGNGNGVGVGAGKKQRDDQNSTLNNNNLAVERSHVTASPAPSGGTNTTGAPKIIKMNLKKNQIKLSNGMALPAKRNSVHNQIAGMSNMAAGIQSKSVSREGRLKVKLIQKSKANALNSSGFGHDNGSPRQSRNVANKISGTAGPLGKGKGSSGQVIKSLRQPVQNSLRGETGRFQENIDFSPDDTDIRGASPMLSYDGNRSALDNPKIVKNLHKQGRNNKQNPFKTSTSRQVATPDLANEKSHITNNFFGESQPPQQNQQMQMQQQVKQMSNHQDLIDLAERQRAGTSAEIRQPGLATRERVQPQMLQGSKRMMEPSHSPNLNPNHPNSKLNLVDPQQVDQLRQGQNVSTLSAGPYPLKIKRQIKLQKDKIKTRRKTQDKQPSHVVQQSQQISQEQADSEAFNEIARNLRTSAQNVQSVDQTQQAGLVQQQFGSNRRSVDESQQDHLQTTTSQHYQQYNHHHHPHLSSEPQTMHTSPATALGDRKYAPLDSYNTTQTLTNVIPSTNNINQASASTNKSRQACQGSGGGFVRTHKSRKSRQSGDLGRGFGTERVSFHQSNGQSSKQGMELPIEEGLDFRMPENYAKPSTQNQNSSTSATVRVQSHSQPPLEKQSVKSMSKVQVQVQTQQNQPNKNQLSLKQSPPGHNTTSSNIANIIPTNSSNQNSNKTEGGRASSQNANARRDPQTGHLILNVKRPIVKMAGINFVTAPSSSGQQQHQQATQDFQSMQQAIDLTNENCNADLPPSSTSQQQQTVLPKKKASLAQALETSPYLTQTRINNNQGNAGVSTGSSQGGGNKRIIQLKRPSTNMTLQNSANQQSLISKNSMFAQRAASRMEQSDHRQNDLNLQTQQQASSSGMSNPNLAQQAQIQTGQPLNQRQATQMRFGKRPSGGQGGSGGSQTQNIQPQAGIITFLRPQSDLSDAASNYQ